MDKASAIAVSEPEPDLHVRIDDLERAMLSTPEALIDLPLTHRFTKGMYIREIFMPAGSLITSKIHKTQHPYVVLVGNVSVLIPGKGVQHIEAPHMGITEPNTRRVLLIREDTIWVTFHPNPDDEQDLEVIESRLIEQRELEDGKTAFEIYSAALVGQEFIDKIDLEAAMQQDYGGAP